MRFTRTQFVISNLDDQPWSEACLLINPGVLSDGFRLNAGTIGAGNQYSVGALQFADGDGLQFNPLQQKPQTFRIAKVNGELRVGRADFGRAAGHGPTAI